MKGGQNEKDKEECLKKKYGKLENSVERKKT